MWSVAGSNASNFAQRIRPRSRGTQLIEATNTPPLTRGRRGGMGQNRPERSVGSFWTIADATAPGIISTHQPYLYPAPIDGGRDVGRTFQFTGLELYKAYRLLVIKTFLLLMKKWFCPEDLCIRLSVLSEEPR